MVSRILEFGAQQVLIVRNEEAKLTLPHQFQGALVLTVEESKGLEFEDVFLVSEFTLV